MRSFLEFWKSCKTNEKQGFVLLFLIVSFFIGSKIYITFDPTARCNVAQSELEDAQNNESHERTQALAGKRASAGIAITDAMDRTSDAAKKLVEIVSNRARSSVTLPVENKTLSCPLSVLASKQFPSFAASSSRSYRSPRSLNSASDFASSTHKNYTALFDLIPHLHLEATPHSFEVRLSQ